MVETAREATAEIKITGEPFAEPDPKQDWGGAGRNSSGKKEVRPMFSRMFEALRVTPRPPAGRSSFVPADDMPSLRIRSRDGTSSWACHIRYVNDRGVESERTITCKRLSGYGDISHIDAYCHAKEMARRFRIDRIVELVDVETGEVMDAASQFATLQAVGALPYEDKGYSAFVQIAAFMAKCDGHYHPMEADALEAAITAYVLRFGGGDVQIADTMARLPAIAPDGGDVAKAVKRLKVSPIGARVSRLILDHCGLIMDADGQHHTAEIAWAVELGAVLKAQAVAR